MTLYRSAFLILVLIFAAIAVALAVRLYPY